MIKVAQPKGTQYIEKKLNEIVNSGGVILNTHAGIDIYGETWLLIVYRTGE
jgi:hypothetical protein